MAYHFLGEELADEGGGGGLQEGLQVQEQRVAILVQEACHVVLHLWTIDSKYVNGLRVYFRGSLDGVRKEGTSPA
jgi:hypothetical protein